MTVSVELSTANLLEVLVGELRATGPGAYTKAFNQALIAEYRTSGGNLTGELGRAPLLLLTTTGARSGKQRTTPLAYVFTDEKLLVVASKAGTATDPLWYSNLVANPEVLVECGAESYRARAVVLDPALRDRYYAAIASSIPTFADYQRRTTRVIPVVELQRLA